MNFLLLGLFLFSLDFDLGAFDWLSFSFLFCFTVTVAEPPISSSSLTPSGDSFLDVSFETPQSTRSAEFSQPILPSVLPLSTRSPLEELIEFNWPPSGAWYGFGKEGEFPPLTLG